MKIGDTVDGRFVVEAVCSTDGGMGNVMFVRDQLAGQSSPRVVLKYCKATDPKLKKRFIREIQLLEAFVGNGRVAQIVACNVNHVPPYYVMRFYNGGALSARQAQIASDASLQEAVFSKMIGCVSELHVAGVFHRDIKPQNFLCDGDEIVVSDMGLSLEVDAQETTLTSTAEAWGTFGYTPPEYIAEFHNADAAGDVFMLGKTFYNLLTGRSPMYMTAAGIPPGVFQVIQRACAHDKSHRYQSLAELKQALVSAYDVVLGRVDGVNKCQSVLTTITSRLDATSQYVVEEVTQFLDLLSALEADEKEQMCKLIPPRFFQVIANSDFDAMRSAFLQIYGEMVRRGSYEWAFAERIANCMQAVFVAAAPTLQEKADSLDFAIHAAVKQNRFAAMNTCIGMIRSVSDNDLAVVIRPVLLRYPDTFVGGIESFGCRNDVVSQTIRDVKAAGH